MFNFAECTFLKRFFNAFTLYAFDKQEMLMPCSIWSGLLGLHQQEEFTSIRNVVIFKKIYLMISTTAFPCSTEEVYQLKTFI